MGGDDPRVKTLEGHEKTVVLSSQLRKHVAILENALDNIKRLADLWELEEGERDG